MSQLRLGGVSHQRSGLGLGSVLLVVFVVLKLTGTTDWSWWWVLSPIWISALLVIVVLAIAAGVIGIVVLRKELKHRHYRKIAQAEVIARRANLDTRPANGNHTS